MGVAVGTGSLLLSVALAAVWRPGPLKRLFAPPPVDGLNARAGLDGRLLGHFPFGELPAFPFDQFFSQVGQQTSGSKLH